MGLEIFAYNAIKIINHQAALEFYETLYAMHDANDLTGSQLVRRFQQCRVHQWLPNLHTFCKAKVVSFAKLADEIVVDMDTNQSVRNLVATSSPKSLARQYVTMCFSNVTTWGSISHNCCFSKEVLDNFSLFGLVETHAGLTGNTDLCARATSHGHIASACVAMDYPLTGGDHGGEAVFVAKHLYAIPLDLDLVDMAASVNDETRRWTATEVRIAKVSIIVVTAYLWCGQGLSQRNWAILQHISALFDVFKTPFILFADFNIDPTTLWQSGWCQHHHVVIRSPDVQSTCSVSNRVIDFFVVSSSISSIVFISVVDVPWSPHIGLCLEVCADAHDVMVRKLLEPLPLPMQEFHIKWKATQPASKAGIV